MKERDTFYSYDNYTHWDYVFDLLYERLCWDSRSTNDEIQIDADKCLDMIVNWVYAKPL